MATNVDFLNSPREAHSPSARETKHYPITLFTQAEYVLDRI